MKRLLRARSRSKGLQTLPRQQPQQLCRRLEGRLVRQAPSTQAEARVARNWPKHLRSIRSGATDAVNTQDDGSRLLGDAPKAHARSQQGEVRADCIGFCHLISDTELATRDSRPGISLIERRAREESCCRYDGEVMRVFVCPFMVC